MEGFALMIASTMATFQGHEAKLLTKAVWSVFTLSCDAESCLHAFASSFAPES